MVSRLRQVWEDTDIFGRTILKVLLTWLSVVIVLWTARDISLQNATLFVIIHCGKNNVGQSHPEDIAVGVMKIAKPFMKNNPKITTIITGMLPMGKTYSIR